MNFLTETDNGVLVITPHAGPGGDTAQLRRIKDTVMKQYTAATRAVVIDLSEVDFIDSGVIGAIVGSCRFLQGKSTSMVVCGIGLRVAETLYIMNLNRALPIRFTRELALTELNRPGHKDVPMDMLLAKNPSIDAVRKWWQESALTREVPKLTSKDLIQPPKVETPRPPTPVPPSSDSADSNDLLAKRESAQDWLRALRLFREAKSLGERYGLDFNAGWTFRDFLSEIAERLEPGNDAPK